MLGHRCWPTYRESTVAEQVARPVVFAVFFAVSHGLNPNEHSGSRNEDPTDHGASPKKKEDPTEVEQKFGSSRNPTHAATDKRGLLVRQARRRSTPNEKRPRNAEPSSSDGAGNEIRTHDFNLGNISLAPNTIREIQEHQAHRVPWRCVPSRGKWKVEWKKPGCEIRRGDRVRIRLCRPRAWAVWGGGVGPSKRGRRCVWRPPRRQACAPPSTICRQRSPRSERTRGRRVRPARTRKLRPNNRAGEVSSEPDQEIQLCIWCPAPTWSWTFERKSNDDSKQKPDA